MDRRHPARLIRHAAQRTCRRSMRTATAALGTTMSRPSSLAGSYRVSLPISSRGAAKDCALSLTWSGRTAENTGLLKRHHRSRSQRRFPEDALVANVGCRRLSSVAVGPGDGPLTERTAGLHAGVSGTGLHAPLPTLPRWRGPVKAGGGRCPASWTAFGRAHGWAFQSGRHAFVP